MGTKSRCLIRNVGPTPPYVRRTRRNLCSSSALDGIHIVWHSLRTEPLGFFMCVCHSQPSRVSVPMRRTNTRTLQAHMFIFDSVQTVYDYRLLSQYLDFAGKAQPSLFIFPSLLCVVSVCTVCMWKARSCIWIMAALLKTVVVVVVVDSVRRHEETRVTCLGCRWTTRFGACTDINKQLQWEER